MKKKIIIGITIIIVLFILLLLIVEQNYFNQPSKSNSQDKNITLTESLTIKEGGTYQITGTLTNGSITINTKEEVNLILNNVSIKNEKGPAIYIEDAKKTTIHLSENTKNTLEDSSTYSGYETDINATIYSKQDLTLEGNGTLIIKTNNQDGIVSKDHLNITDGTYYIESIDDGIRGTDAVTIQNGTFHINSGGDGIKSTNEKDQTKGTILIQNGTFNITSQLDGIQAITDLTIQDGTFHIQTGGGSTIESTKNDWGKWGTTSTDSPSAKGIKGNNLIINKGTFTLDTSDDAIHANDTITIEDGTYTIKSGDDGIHADTKIDINGGSITIEKSYEGIEATQININDGNINVTSSDDGINIAGGNDNSSMNRPGANNYNPNTTNILTINKGTIYVNANGDGIDVNGNAYIKGGTIFVDGPSDSGNSALDYDGEFIMDQGTLIAVGSKGMSQGISANSKQYNLQINFDTIYEANQSITISNGSETIISYTPKKSFSSATISSKDLKIDTTYTLKVGDTTITTFTINSITTTIGNNNQTGFFSPTDHRSNQDFKGLEPPNMPRR